jgi:teichuronic acid exporter
VSDGARAIASLDAEPLAAAVAPFAAISNGVGGAASADDSQLSAMMPEGTPPAGSATHNQAIATGVMWQGALRWLSQALSWTATIVIARRLSPEDYGIAGSATVIVGLLTLVTEGGLGRALVLRRDRDDAVVQQAHGAAIATGFATALLMLLSAWPLSRFYNEPRVMPVVALLSLALLFSGANTVPLAVMQQQLQYRRLAAIDFGKAIAQASTVLLCSLLGMRYWSLAIGLLVGHVAAMVWTRRYVQLISARPTRALLGPTIEYARHLVISALAWYMYSNADFAVVGKVVGLSALGYYQFAWNVAQLPGEKLANVLQAVVGPFFGSIGDDRSALRHYFLVLSELLVSIMLPVLCGFALVSPLAVPLIFGDKWLTAVPVLQVLVISSALSSMALLSQHVLGATGQAIVATRLNLWALLILPASFYLAAKLFGPLAVACVWLGAQPVLIGFPLMRMKQTIDLSLMRYLRSLKAPVLSALLMCIAVMLMQGLVKGMVPILQLIALCAVGAVVYAVTYVTFFHDRVRAIRALWQDRT